jgi:hypothetical protein
MDVNHAWRTNRSRRWLLTIGGCCLLAFALVTGATPAASNAVVRAQAAARLTQAQHLDLLAKLGRNYVQRLRPEVLKQLSAGGQQLVKLSQEVDKVKAAAAKSPKGKAQGPKSLPQGFGSDPFAAEDLFSRLTGMTQSETTAGWCASRAALGFNDSGSFAATVFLGASPSGSLSFNGWSQSTDGGGSYTDRGALLADPLPPGIEFRDLLGDPVLGCSSEANFHYASLAMDVGPGGSFANSGISVSRSTNGGTSFDSTVMAVAKDAEFHFLDKEWLAVEPGATAASSDDVLHVTYTDFDFSGFADQNKGLCPDDVRVAIEYVRSTDGGDTWSSPLVLEELCAGAQGAFLQGSQVEAGLGDDVYVAWERLNDDQTRDVRIRRSTDLGASFGAASVATPVTPVGDGFALQGLFRSGPDLQGLAVDRGTGPRRGTVYLSLHDGRNRTKPDPLGFCQATPTYCFGDILVTSSTGGGTTWSAPARVNDDAATLGVDQWQPALDVDRSGTLWVAFYDRRRDTRNFLIDTFVAKSTDGGARWQNTRLTQSSFAPVTGWQDVVVNPVYMGDYIAAAADTLGRSSGVVTAWGDNTLGDANVLQRRT